MRHMTIAPGGVVPLHSHEDRPALIMVNSGEIYENSSKCAEPILHKAGDIAREFAGHQALVEEHHHHAGGADDRRHRQRQEAGNDGCR